MTILLNVLIGLCNSVVSTSCETSSRLLALSPVPSSSSSSSFLCYVSRATAAAFYPQLVPVLRTDESLPQRRRKEWQIGLQKGSRTYSTDKEHQLTMSADSTNKQPKDQPLSLTQAMESAVSSFYMSDSIVAPRSSNTKPEKNDDSAADSSIEIIEQRTKASIDKLKHILYKVKTRPSDGSLINLAEEWSASESARTEFRLQKLRDMGLFDNNNNNAQLANKRPDISEELPFHSSFPEVYVEQDDFTSTKTTVKIDRVTKSAIVTIIATVTDPAEEKSLIQEPSENTISQAAREIARCAATLEEKATAAALASKFQEQTFADSASEKILREHEKLVDQMTDGEIVEATQVRKGYYAGTPFRPVYKVKLKQADGSLTEALLKPAVPGDVHCSWGNASSDWVAYKLGRLLGMDMVPPAAMRRNVHVGDKVFPLVTLLYVVNHVKPLTRLTPQEWGGELPALFVSNAHILDALMGTCPRGRTMFMEGSSWTGNGAKQAMLLDHPLAPGHGKLHPMWTYRGQVSGIKCVSENTLTRLRNLNKTVLTAVLGQWVTSEGLDHIVERLEQVLTYFDAVAQHGNRSLAVV